MGVSIGQSYTPDVKQEDALGWKVFQLPHEARAPALLIKETALYFI